jgi:PIN domain nuclease of toxin-antitoxin system
VKGLLDTHTFIWWDSDPGKISSAALTFLRDAGNEVLLSVVSGRSSSSSNFLAVESLPTPHKDPLDRLLVAQAQVEGAVLLTADGIFARYPVQVLW